MPSSALVPRPTEPAPNRIDAVIASATASVAEVCDAQVGQVKTALSHACESEVRQLRAVLAEACAGETDKLRNALSSACDRELQRVSSSLATACAREVEAVSSSCQTEVERVKQALRQACELEVASVREACRSEVQLVKEALREACEAEVRLVRDACQSEVQRVKTDLAEACQQEVSSLISSMQHDVAEARQRQRRELEAAAEPYIRAVHSAQLSMSSQLEALNERQSVEERRVRTLESQALRTSQKLAHMTIAAGARDRSIAIDSRMRNGGLFLTLRVNRPVGHIAQMMGIKPKLEVSSHVIRLSRDGEALHLHTLQEPPSHRDAASEHVRMPIGRLPLGSFVSVSLGAPTWASRAAAFDLPELHAASAARLAAGHALDDAEVSETGDVLAGGDGEGVGAPPPSWHLITLESLDGPPLFLCALTANQAISWAAGLAALLPPPPPPASPAEMPPPPPPTYAALLWRRVRLRLDAGALDSSKAASDAGTHEGPLDAVTLVGAGGGLGGGSRLGVLAGVLRSMAAEEEARKAWVQYHLAKGDKQQAKRMGYVSASEANSEANVE